MYNILKTTVILKHSKSKLDDYVFLKTIAKGLSKYDFVEQINKDFIIGKRVAMLSEKQGSYTYIFNAELEKKFMKPGFPNMFLIKSLPIPGSATGWFISNRSETVKRHLSTWGVTFFA